MFVVLFFQYVFKGELGNNVAVGAKKEKGASDSRQDSRQTKSRRFWIYFGEICEFSWRSIFAHPWVLVLLFLLNIVSLFAFSFYGQPLGEKINYTLQLMGDLFTHIVQSVDSSTYVSAAAQSTMTDVILNDSMFQHLANNLISLFALLAAAALVVYTFFQSSSVRLVGWMVLDRRPYSIWTFFKLTLTWYIFYLIVRIIILAADLAYAFFSSGKGILDGLDFLYVVLHVVLFYFVFISYTFAMDKQNGGSVWRAIKNSFVFGVKKIHYYLINYIPFALFLIPFTNLNIISPALNLLNPLGVVGYGLQLAILFLFYIFYVANNFTITHEVAADQVKLK